MDPARRSPRNRRNRTCPIFVLIAFATLLRAQTLQPPTESPAELVKAVVANEVAANDLPIKHLFRSYKKTPKGTQTHLYVETDTAMAGMLIGLNDHPLSAQQQQGEDGHLAWLTNNPDQLRKKQAREKEDTERSLRIVKALPYAFHYQYAGTEVGTAGVGSPGATLVRLKFTPNRDYNPPSRVEEVLAGMEGTLLIDAQAKRLAEIDGTLFKDITFGWGLVGRLDKGGHFLVRQADLGDGSWDITEMHLSITGKILLVKSLTMISDERFSDFQRMPDHLSFAQGVEKLKAQQEKMEHPDTQARNPNP